MNDEFEDTYDKYSCWLCLSCYQSEPYRIFVRVPRKGYAPGEAIEITINIDNKSNQKFEKFIGKIFKVNYANKLYFSPVRLLTFKSISNIMKEININVPSD